jgi:4-hydroxy-4-methyl-2-oxoglutarate aldolase
MNQKLEALLHAGTAVVSDVCDAIGVTPQVLDTALFPIKGAGHGFAGPAYTIQGEARQWQGGDREKLGAIDAMPPHVVGVWAGTDIQGVCCFGDLLASAMQIRQCAGIVVDGGIRDIAYLRTLNMPIVARYRTPAQGIGRWKVTAQQVPVPMRGAVEDWVTVNPGDNIIADDDGVIVVSQNMLDQIYQRVIEWSHTESDAREDVLRGTSLLDALKKYGHL